LTVIEEQHAVGVGKEQGLKSFPDWFISVISVSRLYRKAM
jgi:hypothetical protein